MRDLIEALTIFMKYGSKSVAAHCEHDVIHITGVDLYYVPDAYHDRLYDLGFEWEDGKYMSKKDKLWSA